MTASSESRPLAKRNPQPIDHLLVGPPKVAEHLLARVIKHDDEMGDLANARPDDLRDALRIAAERLRIYEGGEPRAAFMIGTRRLVAEVWWLVQQGTLNSRCMAADAALDLRDQIDPNWMPDADTERAHSGGQP